jgi:hypothetical protein
MNLWALSSLAFGYSTMWEIPWLVQNIVVSELLWSETTMFWRTVLHIVNTHTSDHNGARDSVVVKTLCRKPEGHGFETDDAIEVFQFNFQPH